MHLLFYKLCWNEPDKYKVTEEYRQGELFGLVVRSQLSALKVLSSNPRFRTQEFLVENQQPVELEGTLYLVFCAEASKRPRTSLNEWVCARFLA